MARKRNRLFLAQLGHVSKVVLGLEAAGFSGSGRDRFPLGVEALGQQRADGLFGQFNVAVLDGPKDAACFGQVPGAVGIETQPHVGANGVAHAVNALDVILRLIGRARHLDRGEAHFCPLAAVFGPGFKGDFMVARSVGECVSKYGL